jgi:hypothetical protein
MLTIFGRLAMDEGQWKATAMLTGRNIRTMSGNLSSCIVAFLRMTDTQRATARIIVPGCVSIDRAPAVRTLSHDVIQTLARRLPILRAMAR